MRLLIVGNRSGTNIGGCFERAAAAAQMDVELMEARLAMRGPTWIRRANWFLRGHRPTRLRSFGNEVVEAVKRFKPHRVLATGVAPLDSAALKHIKALGVPAVNYLTDDPWNSSHRAAWFLRALPEYAAVFSTRRANLSDLERAGCKNVTYLPFGYDPELHLAAPKEVAQDAGTDVLFIGAADSERAAYCEELVESGIRLSLYGDFWERFKRLRRFWQGYADAANVKRISAQARIHLCLIRKANRDGHTMRSFEAAALGGCLLVEDTSEHREIFGPDRTAVVYFRSGSELCDSVFWLLARDTERSRLAHAAHERITQGGNTYADRLRRILRFE